MHAPVETDDTNTKPVTNVIRLVTFKGRAVDETGKVKKAVKGRMKPLPDCISITFEVTWFAELKIANAAGETVVTGDFEITLRDIPEMELSPDGLSQETKAKLKATVIERSGYKNAQMTSYSKRKARLRASRADQES